MIKSLFWSEWVGEWEAEGEGGWGGVVATKVINIYKLVPVVSLNCVSHLSEIKLLLFRSGGWVAGWVGRETNIKA